MQNVIIYGMLLAVLIGATLFDLYRNIIPNKLILSGLIGWGLLVVIGWVNGPEHLLAGVAVAVTLLGIRWLGEVVYSRKGMGMGDVKLVFLIGLFLGWQVFWYLYLAIIVGGVWSLGALALKRADKKSKIAFAPFLLIGTCLGLTLLPFQAMYHLWY